MTKRILLIGDSARINTGYGVVLRNIGNSLAKDDRFEVRQLGLYEQVAKTNKNAEEVNFQIYEPRYNLMYEDKVGEKTFNDILREYCPHIVLTVGDPWYLYYVGSSKIKNKFTWISYVPVDGEPYPRVMPYGGKWLRLADITAKPDYVIAFTEFGKDVLAKANINVFDVINHGTDVDVYRPLEDKLSFRKEFFKDYPDIENSILFGFVGRNQFRKNLPSILKAWKLFTEKFETDKKCYLYLHTPNNDTFKGFNLPEVIKELNIKEHTIILPENLISGIGITEKDMNKLYNSFDCLVSGTMGEGWSLTFSDCMSAGTPIIVPNYSGHLEFASEAAWLINIKDYIIEIISGINRAIIDENHLSELMIKFVNLTDEEKSNLSKACVDRAKDFQWRNVNKKWAELINGIDIVDYKFSKEDFGLRKQDEIFIGDGGRYKIVASPVDISCSPTKYPKVGFVSTYNEKCGIATYTSNLKKAIKDVSGEENGVVFSELADYKILFKQIASSNINILHWQHEPGIIDYGNTLMKFILDMKRVRPDIKHVFTLHAEHPVIKSNIDGLADVAILHANKDGYNFNTTQAFNIEHPLPEYTISDEIRNEYREKIGIKDKIVIGFNGFMTPAKALDQMLKYMGKFIQERDDIVLYFLNSYPENITAKENAERLFGSMTDIINEFDIKDKVIIDTEFYSKEEMSKRIQTFDVGISYMGGETLSQSGSIAEMIANGIPVIASNIGHFKHMIKNGFCIPIEDGSNVGIFANTLKSIITSDNFVITLNSIKTKIIANIGNFSYKEFAKKHLDIYTRLIK